MEDSIIEINLTAHTGGKELADIVVEQLENTSKKSGVAKLITGNISINQSQMIFIKSLIESYGHKLTFVESTNDFTRDICNEIGINTTNSNFQTFSISDVPKENKEENQKDEETNQKMGIYRKADEPIINEDLWGEAADEFYAEKTDEPVEIDTKETIYVAQTLRNGQVIDYDGNVVIIGDCHPGSEIKATGDITVWGILASVAHAGAKGNKEAKIRALKMNAVQLRIADCYSRKPDGENNIPFIAKSSEYTPEEARIVDDSIVLFNLAQN